MPMKTLTSLARSILVSTVILLFAVFAQAQVKELPTRDYSGEWKIQQANGFVVTMKLQQNGGTLRGTASYPRKGKGPMNGTVYGYVWRNRGPGKLDTSIVDYLDLNITWSNASDVGYYKGTHEGIYLAGETFHSSNVNAKVAWRSDGQFRIIRPPERKR